mgnify:CR=1 FL=1
MSKSTNYRRTFVRLLNEEMDRQQVSAGELSRRMNLDNQEITRRTINKWRAGETFSLDGIEGAFRKLGLVIGFMVGRPQEEGERIDPDYQECDGPINGKERDL